MDTENVQKTFHFLLPNKYRKNEVEYLSMLKDFSTVQSLQYFYNMNLTIETLSFWERKWLLEDIDYLVVGAGIVGLSSAYHLKKSQPKAKIIVIDKGILPFSASSKNAGFACFGSPTEILDDLKNISPKEVWETVQMRWKGLNALKNWLGETEIDLQTIGSWDLIQSQEDVEIVRNKMQYLNNELFNITGEKNIYSEDKEILSRFGFEKMESAFQNRLEGQLDTSLLIQRAIKKVNETGITILRGVNLSSYTAHQNEVELNTNFGTIKTGNLLLCTNGFTPEIEEKWDVKPARAQVLVTKKIYDLKIKGTFHVDRGYYYFRNVGDRLLIGGGRNINFKKEETLEIETTSEIQSGILEKLNQIILPNTDFEIDFSWAGIMGVGEKKQPIIERVNDRVCVGIRMGGMGIAIGTLVGQKLAQMNS